MTKEQLAEMIGKMNDNQQKLFYKALEEKGFKETEICSIKVAVTHWKMENVPGFKEKVMELVKNQMFAELAAM